MSYGKVSGVIAALISALVLSAGAYGDTGKSPNGDPGPAGNPNQPVGTPQANGPQGPAGNDQQGQSNSAPGQAQAPANDNGSNGPANDSHGNSNGPHGKSNASHRHHPSQSHANPNPGTPRKGGREDRPSPKITICHATKSVKNPYVEITISVNGLNGHGPADDPRHHAGSWQDIIPAPAGGCPGSVQDSQQQQNTQQQPDTSVNGSPAAVGAALAAPEVTVPAPAGSQEVLGARASGTNAPAAKGGNEVLGAQASGTNVPKAALVARKAASKHHGSLPFTGLELGILLLLAAWALIGGYALRRATADRSQP
jgi:hypothetical protein